MFLAITKSYQPNDQQQHKNEICKNKDPLQIRNLHKNTRNTQEKSGLKNQKIHIEIHKTHTKMPFKSKHTRKYGLKIRPPLIPNHPTRWQQHQNISSQRNHQREPPLHKNTLTPPDGTTIYQQFWKRTPGGAMPTRNLKKYDSFHWHGLLPVTTPSIMST